MHSHDSYNTPSGCWVAEDPQESSAQESGVDAMSEATTKAMQDVNSLVGRAMDLSQLGFAIIDLNGVLLHFNARLLSMFGYSEPMELLGKSICVLTDFTDTLMEMVDTLLTCRTWKGEIRALRKDETSFECDLFADLIEYEKSVSPYASITFIDNTDIRNKMASLNESHSQMERLLNGLSSSVLLTNNKMEILWANKKALEMNPNAIGCTCQEAYAQRDQVCEGCPIKKAIETGEIEEAVIYHEHHVDHPGHWFDVAVPIKNEIGEVTEVIHMATEVTSEIRSREILLETEIFSSKLLESSSNPILVCNPDNSIRYVNPAFSELTGFNFSELVGKKPPYAWWPQKLIRSSRLQLQRTKKRGHKAAEQLLKSKSGEPFWVEINTVPVMLKGELKCYLSIWTDVTERQEQKKGMQYYLRELTRAQEEERKRIARELHDETAQQLACLYTDIDKIIMSLGTRQKKVTNSLKALRLRVDYMMGEIRNLCSLLRPYYLDYYGLATSLALLGEIAKKEWGLDVGIQVIGEEQRLSSETEIQLFRIAQEALHNVSKHSAVNEAKLELRFYGSKVTLIVADNGTGFKMPRSISSFARKGKLGLIGISERAALMDGKFRISSKPGMGTKLLIEIRL